MTLPFIRSNVFAQSTATPAAPTAGAKAEDYMLHLMQVPSAVIPNDVTARKGNQKAWPLLQGVSIAQVEVPVGGWRAPHLHTNTAELAVVLNGTARAALQNPEKEWFEIDLQPGDCVYFPLGWPHWFRNTGSNVLQAYFNYGHQLPATVELPVS
ncbi:cupin domain-containing protein (plasmid) [Deinococcus radiomollis]|uniref:cupin domain-containing protein n=1 Tax=Deinococcus radiomollis TaxID=468916 RepID=UPI00389197E4